MRTIHRGDNCQFVKQPKKATEKIECLPPPAHLLNLGTRSGKCTFLFERPPHISGRMAVAGEREGEGPIGGFIHTVHKDPKMGEKSFELAEIDMLKEAVTGAVESAGYTTDMVDLFLAGDLLNQITTSSYAARDLGMPYMGLYSACSTMSESLTVAAMLINAGYIDNAACATVSHFATAERQYRYPLEYGCQRPPYSQWTVTGAGCTFLTKDGDGPRVTAATVGRVIDFGTTDIGNMGAAMAPAAMDTLVTHFKETGLKPSDYDLILTGDLGKLGSDILRDLMREQGYHLGQSYIDCGSLIYALDQESYQGGSGCGCSATVFNSFVLEKMMAGEYNRVLLAATGALMSAQSCFQGESIPCISHAVVIEN